MVPFSSVIAALFLASVVNAAFDPLKHSGNASPYFNAPTLPGLGAETPEGCVVDQAAYFVRHGSRYPEPGDLPGWQDLQFKIQNATFTAQGPLAFLASWVQPVDNVDHEPLYLSDTGAKEAFELGVELRNRYGFTAGGENFTAWSAGEQRVVDTTTYFLRGYLSAGNYLSDPSLNRGHLIILPDSLTEAQAANSTNGSFADSLTPSASCPPYNIFSANGSTTSNTFRDTYQNQTAARINTFLTSGNLSFDASDIGVMQDLCGFGFEVSGDTRFCDIFTDDEWLDYEYADDLNYYYGAGPGNPFSAVNGFPWIKAVTDLFVVGPNQTVANGTLTPPPLIMGFSHDNNLPPLISALGLWNNTVLSDTQRDTNPLREFRSGHLVAFRGYLALERLSCIPPEPLTNDTGVFHQAGILGGTVVTLNTTTPVFNATAPQLFVRVRADNAPVPIPTCSSGPGQTCPFEEFVDMVNGPLAAAAGDFITVCELMNVTGPGVSGISGDGSTVKFLTTKGDGTEVLVGLN